MSRLSDFLRRRRIDPSHQTRRALIRFIERRGFEVGDHTYGEPRIMPWGDAKLKIGSYCSIGPEVAIFLGGGHHTDWVSTFPFKSRPGYPEAHGFAADPEVTRGDVVIGHDVWIGAGATILSGVTIGHGAVIGARAVVSRDVPPYAIAVGNPARVVRRRFPDAEIAALLETAWWELDRAQIVALLPLLNGPEIAAFIAACRAARGGGRIDFAQASGD